MATERIIREQSQKKIEKPANPGKALALAAALLILPMAAHAGGSSPFFAGFGPGLQQGLYGTQTLPYGYVPRYVPQQDQDPQFHTYSFPNGQRLNCRTVGGATRCN